MTENPYDDPQWQEYADHALAELVPKLDASAVAVALVPRRPQDRSDIKMCLEIGVMIMLDKPLIVMIQPGTQVPAKIAKVADAIVEYDVSDPAGTAQRMQAAAARVLKESE